MQNRIVTQGGEYLNATCGSCVAGHTEAAAAQTVTGIAAVLIGLLTEIGTRTAAAETDIAAGHQSDDGCTPMSHLQLRKCACPVSVYCISSSCYTIDVTIHHTNPQG